MAYADIYIYILSVCYEQEYPLSPLLVMLQVTKRPAHEVFLLLYTHIHFTMRRIFKLSLKQCHSYKCTKIICAVKG